MQKDFHYYATYCAAYLAGYSHEESMAICTSDQFTDLCSRTYLQMLGAPRQAATTQLQLELMEARTDLHGLQDITRIWASFHFLPYDLYAEVKKGSKNYKDKYRLICNTNGPLVADTVMLAKDSSLQAVGIAMHILADTWAHKYFAGTPSLVINNTDTYYFEIFPDGREKRIKFSHNPIAPDDIDNSGYVNSLFQISENSIMLLGHGRAGHLPDYSYARYKYLPAWGNYEEIIKDNPSDYYHAFCQMIYAMKYLHGDTGTFETDRYDFEAAAPYEKEIKEILEIRRSDTEAEWKAFGEKLSGCSIEDFELDKYRDEYVNASDEDKDDTFYGRYFIAAMKQKSMITNKIYSSGSKLAGVSVDYEEKGFKGISDYKKIIGDRKRGDGDD